MTGQQLKASILQLAIQGKLVPQNPDDEPASILLDRIRKEKEKLIRENKLKRDKNPSVIFRGSDGLFYEKKGNSKPVCIQDEIPFEIPASWEWSRIHSLGEIVRGNGIKRNEVASEGYPCVRYGEIYTAYQMSFISTVSFIFKSIFDKSKHFSHGDILMTLTGENKPDIAKAIAYLGFEEGAVGGDLACWTYHGMEALFLSYLLASPYVISRKVELATGDIIVHISVEKLGSILIPVPPLIEQKRIVDKLKEILPMVEDYSTVEKQLADYNFSFPEQLKKSLLQYAMQGKLVPQNPDDEPASVLLERIRNEKKKLVKAGVIKKVKHESEIYKRDNSYYEKIDGKERCIDGEIPFDIPDSWEWGRLGTISESIQYGYNAPAREKGRIRMVRISDIQSGRVLWDTVPFCDIDEDSISDYILKPKDILFARTGGTVGKSFLFREVNVESIYAGYLIRVRYSNHLNPQYIYGFMDSPLYWQQLKNKTTATAQPNCNGQSLANMLIPLPPVNEQKRIVSKIEDVMPYLDDEKRLCTD